MLAQRQGGERTLLEVGCGAGNTAFPLAEADPTLRIKCCDFSPVAVRLVQAHERYDPDRMHAFVCDVSEEDAMAPHIPTRCVDVVTLVFVLSAIPPHKLHAAGDFCIIMRLNSHPQTPFSLNLAPID